MKKLLTGAIVGGIIMFVWQFLSFALINLHRPAQGYTPKQEEILSYLSEQFTEDGQYFLPNYPPGASNEEMQAAMKAAQGKPWAVVAYHKSNDSNMTMNMIRGLLTDIFMVGILCWILSKMPPLRYSTILLISILIGLISFCNVPYTNHIWYETFDLNAYLIDAIAGWGLVGLWLGYVYRSKLPVR